jgi:hypothetical protein
MVTTERHEIPTHLNVEDRAFYGLSVRQVMYLTGGFSLGYSLWTQWGDALPELRIAMAVTCALVAIILALVRPAGRGFEEWAFVVLRYLVIPHRARWSPAELDLSAWRSADDRWVELAPRRALTEDRRCDG